MSVLNLMDSLFNQWLLSLRLLAHQNSVLTICNNIYLSLIFYSPGYIFQMLFQRKPRVVERKMSRTSWGLRVCY